ncbi:alpha/beta hydrolase [Pseudoroseomonas aestuarii]|uniref:Alpha/beta hydrolase n=1 Tax=Teichococcus aestuarii TaxID=568898 RepID=A0A2U1V1C6_9PROT|nr:alpha/beta hydrolase [Pseudoroseomonas aestuarii]
MEGGPDEDAVEEGEPVSGHGRPGRLAWGLGAAALVLGALALGNRVAARRAERRHAPQGHFVTVGGVRLHYLDEGQGQPVVLLHGNGATVEDFRASGVLGGLARRYRVLAFDRPGFGHSGRPRGTVWTAGAQAEILRKALRQLGIHQPLLLGHSWGALAALAMALDAPRDTRGAILLSGYYFPGPRLDVLLPSLSALPLLGDILCHTLSPVLGRAVLPALLRRIFAPRPVSAAFTAGFPRAMALRPGQLRASAADTALMLPGAAALLRRHGDASFPVILLAGAEDRMVTTDRQSRRLQPRIPGSELRILPGEGHMIHHTAPGAIIAAVDDAMRRAGAPARQEGQAP